MQVRHNNAILRRQVVLVDDVIDRDDATTVEIQFEDEMIMILMDGSFDDLGLEEVEMVTHFWMRIYWFYLWQIKDN